MADARRRARLTPVEISAAVAVAEAQIDGRLVNARPFHKAGRVRFRVELDVPAEQIEALLAALAEPEPAAVR